MSELKLKPCPCCESDEVIYFKKTRNRGYVTCIACGMRTRGCGNYEHKDDLKWRERATILWNRRKPMANIVGKLEEREKYLEKAMKESHENGHRFSEEKAMNERVAIRYAINIVKQEINKENQKGCIKND